MKRICAWCGRAIDAGGTGEESGITHGICPACRESLASRSGTPLTRFLDSLDQPVVLLDGSMKVAGASPIVNALLERRPYAPNGIGDVFECVEADGAGGCMRSIHCSGCTIRRSVAHTYETGESLTRVPATLTQQPVDSPREIRMYISTEKLGDQVLLRIDEAVPAGS